MDNHNNSLIIIFASMQAKEYRNIFIKKSTIEQIEEFDSDLTCLKFTAISRKIYTDQFHYALNNMFLFLIYIMIFDREFEDLNNLTRLNHLLDISFDSIEKEVDFTRTRDFIFPFSNLIVMSNDKSIYLRFIKFYIKNKDSDFFKLNTPLKRECNIILSKIKK